jgi:gentisate 1,2-dioxygenase
MSRAVAADSLELLDRDMAEKQLMGFWRWEETVLPYPKTTVKPHLWRWDDIYQCLSRAGDLVDMERSERRVALLTNPGLPNAQYTTHTLHAAMQYLKPHEHARTHRHSAAALRFILRGNGAYTTVDGQQCVMEEGDLILTPKLTWHDHGNDTDAAIVWLDALDIPLILALHQFTQENYAQPRQPILATSEQVGHLFGLAQAPTAPGFPLLHYRWRDTYPALQALMRLGGGPDRFDGYLLEYRNPLTGGSTLPAIQCALQLLPPGQATDAHRHTSTVIYHVVQGTGVSVVDGQRFDWSRGDTFVVPLWCAHQHANTATAADAILFSISDAPLLKFLALYREEAAARMDLPQPAR